MAPVTETDNAVPATEAMLARPPRWIWYDDERLLGWGSVALVIVIWELAARITLLEAEIARTAAHRDKAKSHRAAADALFGKPPGGGSAA